MSSRQSEEGAETYARQYLERKSLFEHMHIRGASRVDVIAGAQRPSSFPREVLDFAWRRSWRCWPRRTVVHLWMTTKGMVVAATEVGDLTERQPLRRSLLKRAPGRDAGLSTVDRVSEDEGGTVRIRCPLCSWQPTRSSRWSCSVRNTPEPPFGSCGTVWNTFDTRGRCPGCLHQWIWTTCIGCGTASPHEDWYEQEKRHPV